MKKKVRFEKPVVTKSKCCEAAVSRVVMAKGAGFDLAWRCAKCHRVCGVEGAGETWGPVAPRCPCQICKLPTIMEGPFTSEVMPPKVYCSDCVKNLREMNNPDLKKVVLVGKRMFRLAPQDVTNG